MNNTLLRSISGLIYALVLFLGTTHFGSIFMQNFLGIDVFQGEIFLGLIAFLFVGTFIETAWFMNFDNKFFIFISLVVACIPFYIFYNHFNNNTYYFFNDNLFRLKNSLYFLLFIVACITVFKYPDELSLDTSKLIFLCAYLGVPFSLCLIIPKSIQSLNLFSNHIFYIFLLIWISDSFAYLVGRLIGKRKLAPKISPKKTIEGFIGGIFFTIIGGITIQYYVSDAFLLEKNWIIIALIISIVAPIGDLVASKLKREFDVKDSGFLIPGHGGLLDRLDSFIACIPFIYLYFLLT